MTTSTQLDSRQVRRSVATQLHTRLHGLQRRARSHDPSALRPLAELRRGAGTRFGSVAAADAVLLRLVRLPATDAGDPPPLTPWLGRLLDDALLVASLVAVTRVPVRDPAGAGRGSFGADLRALTARRAHAAEHLMSSVLGADREDLDVHLRRAITLLGSDGYPLDVAALVRDLGAWHAEGQPVQRRWAYDFWGAAGEGDVTTNQGEDD